MRALAASVAIGSSIAIGAAARSASADTLVIERPGAHPRYFFEAEPHLAFGLFGGPGPVEASAIGAGFRGAIELVDNGFIAKLNNTVAVGFGADWVYWGSAEDREEGPCVRYEDVGGSPVCNEWQTRKFSSFHFPVVGQWNFWISRAWSVFGELGLAITHTSHRGLKPVDPVLDAGGRWHFQEHITLTLRLGYPTFTAGVSFLL